MRAVLLAYHDVGCAGLRTLLEAGDEIVAVYTHADDPDEGAWFGSVADLARQHDIPVFFPEQIGASRWVEQIRQQHPDILFSFYYRRLVPSSILEIPRLGAMNLHGSYLPHYRGRCPLNWVLIRGESRTGVTLHYMVERADAGDIVAQRPIEIAVEDDAATLHRKIVAEATVLLHDALPSIREGTNSRAPQDIGAGSCFGGRRPEDGQVDWSGSAEQIHNLIRGVTHPFPGARSQLDGRTLYLWRSRPEAGGESAGLPGAPDTRDGLTVATGQGRLRLLSCQLDGEEELDAAEFIERHGDLLRATRLGSSAGAAR